MGQTFICGENRGSSKEDNGPLFQEYEIRGFHDGLRANPIFKNRFRNVPASRILEMANQVLEILRLSVKQKDITAFENILDLHVLMNITEVEIDAFIMLFLQECRIEGEIFWDRYENILKCMKQRLISNHFAIGGFNRMQFYTEIKRNPILRERFKSFSPFTILQMSSELSNIMANTEQEKMICALADSHCKFDISEEEFDEFVKIYLETCSMDVEFAARGGARIGQTITKIRKMMVQKK